MRFKTIEALIREANVKPYVLRTEEGGVIARIHAPSPDTLEAISDAAKANDWRGSLKALVGKDGKAYDRLEAIFSETSYRVFAEFTNEVMTYFGAAEPGEDDGDEDDDQGN